MLSLAKHEYLQPPMPKHRLTSNAAAAAQQQQAAQAQQQAVAAQAQQQQSNFSTGMFGAMNASSSS